MSKSIVVIDNLRVPLTLLVIFCHASIGGGIRLEDYENVPLMIQFHLNVCSFFSFVFGQLAVPVFFMISGYLFFLNMKQWNWRGYKSKLQSRVYTLLIPYIVWNILYTLFKSLSSSLSFYDYVLSLGVFQVFGFHCDITTNALGLPHFECSPLLGSFWYLQQLMFLCVVSPFIYVMCKRMPVASIGVMYVVYIMNIWITGTAMLFFSIGSLLALSGKAFDEYAKKYSHTIMIIAICIAVMLMFVGWREQEATSLILYRLFVPFGVLSLIYICGQYRCDKIIVRNMSECSFFVYAAHMFIVPYTYSEKITNMWSNIPMDMMAFFVRPILIYVSLVAFCILLRRHLPFVHGILTGRKYKECASC